jgi:hypothetical protein
MPKAFTKEDVMGIYGALCEAFEVTCYDNLYDDEGEFISLKVILPEKDGKMPSESKGLLIDPNKLEFVDPSSGEHITKDEAFRRLRLYFLEVLKNTQGAAIWLNSMLPD